MRYILTYLFLIQYCFCYAQFSIDTFLSSATEDVDLLSNKSQSGFLSENNFNSPWINRVEFRTRTNNWDILQDDFRLRFSPTNPSEIKANKDYYQIQIDALQSEYLVNLNNALLKRYKLLLEYMMLIELLELADKEVIIQSDILEIEKHQVGKSILWLDKILDEEERLTRMVLQRNEIQQEIFRTELEIRNLYSFEGPIQIDPATLMNVEDIGSFVDIINSASDTTDIFLAFRNHELLLENQRYTIEKAEQRRNIGYFQLEYDRLRGDEYTQHMGFQIGIRLPITHEDRPDLNRRLFDITGEDAEAEKESQEMLIERKLSIVDLEYNLEQYSWLDNYLLEKKAVYNVENFPIREVDDVYAILKIKEANLSLTKTQFDITRNIYQQYFDWLYLNGKLVQIPLINYLDKELKEL